MGQSKKEIRAYGIQLYDPRFFELAKESGDVYTKSLNKFWEVLNTTGQWLSMYELQDVMNAFVERKTLHSDSFLGAMQLVHKNLASWKEAKKVNPDAKPPYKERFLQSIVFKKSQIRIKNKKLSLSLDNKKSRLEMNWNSDMPTPTYATVSYNKHQGWKLNLTMEMDVEQEEENLNEEKTLSIDLGVKRVATLFDGERVITLSGKKLKGLTHYRNKMNALTQKKLAKKVKGSKKCIRVNAAKRKKTARILDKQKDILHKQSNFVVDYAVEHKIKNIVIGKCDTIHDGTNLGKQNNQQVQQNPEQKLKNYIKYKFKGVGGNVEVIPEDYTTKTCPICEELNKPKNRDYKCGNCGFEYDRDGVGTINIYKRKVSFIENERIRLLARPFGIKFKDDLSLWNFPELLNVESTVTVG